MMPYLLAGCFGVIDSKNIRIISQTNKNIAESEGTQKLYAEQNDINII